MVQRWWNSRIIFFNDKLSRGVECFDEYLWGIPFVTLEM